jgi:hypothetical protein
MVAHENLTGFVQALHLIALGSKWVKTNKRQPGDNWFDS